MPRTGRLFWITSWLEKSRRERWREKDKYFNFSKLNILIINGFNMDCNRILQKQVVQIVGFRSAALIL